MRKKQLPLLDEVPAVVKFREDRPEYRLRAYGTGTLSLDELLVLYFGEDSAAGVKALLVPDVFGLTTVQDIGRLRLDQLEGVAGVGPAKAAQFLAGLELAKRITRAVGDARPTVRSPADAAGLLLADMADLEQEELRVILLNTRNDVINIVTAYKGSLNSAAVRVCEVFKGAIRQNACAIIVAHNHPSGDPSPSPEDVRVTRALVEAGRLMDIEVLDHVVIGQGRWVSMKERGLGF